MDRQEMQGTFEAFFEKFKKTEGDRTSWSAFWSTYAPAGTLEIILTKCPRGTTFKVYVDKKKVREIAGWEHFFDEMAAVSTSFPGVYDAEEFFSSMREML